MPSPLGELSLLHGVASVRVNPNGAIESHIGWNNHEGSSAKDWATYGRY
jgi:hypothetical protein